MKSLPRPAADVHVIADDGVRLRTTVTGRGPTMVFCHGGPGLWDYTQPLAGMVDDLVTVVRWDQRGGGSSDRIGPHTVARYVADLDAIRRASGDERIIVGGHSWGAVLALRYALAHPARVHALLLVSTNDLHWSRHRSRHVDAIEERLADEPRWAALRSLARRTREEAAELVRLESRADYADRTRAPALVELWSPLEHPINGDANRALNDEIETTESSVADACRRLDLPTGVIVGREDPRPLDGPCELADVLPNARLIELDDVGHLPWAEHPDRLRAALRGFLVDILATPDG